MAANQFVPTHAIGVQVAAAELALKTASEAFYATQRAAERVRDAEQAPHRAALNALRESYADRAHDLSIADRSCPYTRSGGRMQPDEVEVSAAGLELTWDINGNYAAACYLATWEALLASEGSQA